MVALNSKKVRCLFKFGTGQYDYEMLQTLKQILSAINKVLAAIPSFDMNFVYASLTCVVGLLLLQFFSKKDILLDEVM